MYLPLCQVFGGVPGPWIDALAWCIGQSVRPLPYCAMSWQTLSTSGGYETRLP